MRFHWVSLTAVAVGLVFAVGCEAPSGRPDNTATGALVGGAVGAGTGAVIGGHDAAAGALIGGAVGAITGGIIGNVMDQQQREQVRQYSPQTVERIDQGQPLGLADVKALARASLSDEVIISQIRNSRTVYHLSTVDIIDLKNSGVGEPVIDFMINTASYVSTPPPQPPPLQYQEVVVTQPPPPPLVENVYYQSPGPGYVWVGGSWIWYGNRWVWTRGRWAYPPHQRAVWVNARWEQRGGSGVWVSGHWR